MSKRRAGYEVRVAKFIADTGPKFTLAQIAVDQPGLDCQCCGYKNIVNHYHVVSEQGPRYIIGSECQELVLGFTDAHMPAVRVRALDPSQLVILASKYGLTLNPSALTQLEMANQILAARRAQANVLGWVSRRREGKAPVKAADQLALPQTGTV
jgi:hypothetical protein